MKEQTYSNTKRVGFFNEVMIYGDLRVAVNHMTELSPSEARDLIDTRCA